jgi:hypothetical protein
MMRRAMVMKVMRMATNTTGGMRVMMITTTKNRIILAGRWIQRPLHS